MSVIGKVLPKYYTFLKMSGAKSFLCTAKPLLKKSTTLKSKNLGINITKLFKSKQKKSPTVAGKTFLGNRNRNLSLFYLNEF
jgi:hypothetical protein